MHKVNYKIIYKILFVFMCFFVSASVYASAVRITGFSIKNEAVANFNFVLSAKPEYKIFYLSNPARVVIDVQDAVLATSFRQSSLAETAVQSIRTGTHPGILRIVLDLRKEVFFQHEITFDAKKKLYILTVNLSEFMPMPKKKVVEEKVHEAPPAQEKPKPVVTEKKTREALKETPLISPKTSPGKTEKPALMKAKTEEKVVPPPLRQQPSTTSETIVKKSVEPKPETVTRKSVEPKPIAVKVLRPPEFKRVAQAVEEAKERIPENNLLAMEVVLPKTIPTSDTKVEIIRKEKPKPEKRIARSKGMRDVIIVVDPGHGGKDPGVTGVNKTQEKNIVFLIGKYLQDGLNKEEGFKVILTRSGDYFVPLRKRLKIAHDNSADLFISLHADAYKGSYFYNGGASIFALSKNGATSLAASWLARQENASELKQSEVSNRNMELRSLLIGLAQNVAVSKSLSIGQMILQQLSSVTRLHQNRIEQADFVVLRSPDIPSLLVEVGFLSDASEEKRITQVDYEQNFAEALAQGIKQYFSERPPLGTYLAAAKSASDYEKPNTLGADLVKE